MLLPDSSLFSDARAEVPPTKQHRGARPGKPLNNEKAATSQKPAASQKPGTRSLFWSFYKLVANDYCPEKEFQLKQQYSIGMVEKLRDQGGALLKEHKVTLAAFESSIVYDAELSVDVLKVLCAFHRISLLYTDDSKYYWFGFGEEAETVHHVHRGGETQFRTQHYSPTNAADVAQIEQLKQNRVYIENTKRVLKTAGGYKLDELVAMATTLQLPLVAAATGKKKTKAVLYQEIAEKLHADAA